MRLRLFAAAAALLVTPAAHAQLLSVYGTFTDTHVSNVETGDLLSANTYTEQYTSFNAPGFGGGVTLNALNLPVISFGLDLRGSSKPGNNGADTGLAGLKLTVHPPLLPIKPYVQVSGGYLATRTTNLTTFPSSSTTVSNGSFVNHYAMYEVIGGIDYKLIHFVDLRLIEFGVGKAYNTGISFNGQNPSATVFTINSGIVFHL